MLSCRPAPPPGNSGCKRVLRSQGRCVAAVPITAGGGLPVAQKPIREYDAKNLLHQHWPRFGGPDPRPAAQLAQVTPDTTLDALVRERPWLVQSRLALKPDVVAGRRGKQGLVLLNATWDEARNWLGEQRGREVTIGDIKGRLTHFLIEPFVAVQQELYMAIKTERTADEMLFSTRGGVDVEEHWQEVRRLRIPLGRGRFEQPDWQSWLGDAAPGPLAAQLARFADSLYRYFVALGLSYLEINPLAVTAGGLVPLDLKCRLDDAARSEAGELWGELEFPAPFGREATPEERFVANLDRRSGASLKLTVLNPEGLLWTMVAGGGASVVYTDTIADLGHAGELANYGEYSGNPSADEAYEYARIILDLMTRKPAPPGLAKQLLIGGGIANFTDVAETFAGIIKAIREAAPRLCATPACIWVRRGGPNYEEGLRQMRVLGEELGIAVAVFGPEAHMTRIVRLALDAVAAQGGRR